MTAVSKEGAIKLIQLAATQRRGNHEVEGEIREFVEIVFANFEAPTPVVWNPPEPRDLLRSSFDYQFNRAQLRQQAAQYADNYHWMHNQHVDWLMAHLLITAEVVATANSWSSGWLYRGRFNWAKLLLALLLFLVGWGIWLAITIGIAAIAGEIAAWFWIAITICYQLNAWRIRRRNRKLLAEMAAVYEAARSSTVSWAVIWDMLNRTRIRGAVWDPELYRLVEIFKQRQAAAVP